MKLKYLFFLLFIYTSCNNNRTKQVNVGESFTTEPKVYDSCFYYPIKDNLIKVNLEKPQKASLFDYFSRIELIPLETNDDVLIGYCEEINYYQDRYYLIDRAQHRVYVFDNAGKFVFQINKRGQGPGEYNYLCSIFLNPFTNNIDLTSDGLIYSYDLEGNYKKTSLNPENASGYFYNFIALNENVYVCSLLRGWKTDDYRIHYYNLKENKIIHKEYNDDAFLNVYVFISFTSHTPFYEYNGKWFFYRFVDNVTYEVGMDSLIKAYTWDFGKYNYEAKKLKLEDLITLPYKIDLQGQNNRYLLAYIHSRINNAPLIAAYLILDKSTGECKYIENFTESVNFVPRKVSNEYVLSWCTHEELENFVSEEMLDKDNRQKFQKLINEKDEMNPIIIKYYFK